MVAHAWDNNGEDAPPDSAAVVRGGLSPAYRGLSPAYHAMLSSPYEKGVD